VASLENPQPNSYQSGIGLLSGWSCTGPSVSMVVDGTLTLAMPYGSARTDTASVCGAGNTNTGFGLLVNFNTLGPGTHSAQLLVNGAIAGTTQFTVTVPAGEFMTGASKDVTVNDFPSAGRNTVLTWQQSQQNFAIKSVTGGTTTSTTSTTLASGLDGSKLFATYCVCHTPAERKGSDSSEIKAAITSVDAMGMLAFLSDAQVDAIALYLK
jgi:hypothetical protein